MNLILQRYKGSPNGTPGLLMYENLDTVCHVQEDVVRAKGVKVAGKTAIPAGKYKVIVNMSNRFKREMCLLLDVPMFEGIRIHGGNTAADTLGCLLVAKNRINIDTIQGSMEKFVTALVKKAYADGEEVFIIIKDAR